MTWCDPPPRGRWARVAEELKSRPGKWKVVQSEVPKQNTYGMTRLRKLGCEVTTRQENYQVTVWARWPE